MDIPPTLNVSSKIRAEVVRFFFVRKSWSLILFPKGNPVNTHGRRCPSPARAFLSTFRLVLAERSFRTRRVMVELERSIPGVVFCLHYEWKMYILCFQRWSPACPTQCLLLETSDPCPRNTPRGAVIFWSLLSDAKKFVAVILERRPKKKKQPENYVYFPWIRIPRIGIRTDCSILMESSISSGSMSAICLTN